ncbi:MAG: outer membrane beta-barrel protein [Terriglobales bacterium]
MKDKLLPILVLLLCCMPLFAQSETPKTDIFGGYSHVGNFGVGLNGWIASANWNIVRWAGVEADLSGDYGSKSFGPPFLRTSIGSRMHSFNFGPSVTYRQEKYNAFGHLLFGVSHTNINAAGFEDGDTSFSWILGGGADYNLTEKWAARFQLDLLRTNFFDHGDNHGRVSLGIVYRFGEL